MGRNGTGHNEGRVVVSAPKVASSRKPRGGNTHNPDDRLALNRRSQDEAILGKDAHLFPSGSKAISLIQKIFTNSIPLRFPLTTLFREPVFLSALIFSFLRNFLGH